MIPHRATHARAVDPAIVFTSCELMGAQEQREAAAAQAGSASAQPGQKRREVIVKGRRVKTIDVHAHCLIPAACKLVGQDAYRHHTDGILLEDAAKRLRDMDVQGIDMEALSINPFWYRADRDTVAEVVRLNNEGLVEICARNPDRFVAFAVLVGQPADHPDTADLITRPAAPVHAGVTGDRQHARIRHRVRVHSRWRDDDVTEP
jgi:aminocarboxymuconate-semialdehyde decarboxylase